MSLFKFSTHCTCLLKPTCCSKHARTVAPLRCKEVTVSASEPPAIRMKRRGSKGCKKVCAEIHSLACDDALRIVASPVCKHTPEMRTDSRTETTLLQEGIRARLTNGRPVERRLRHTDIHAPPRGHGRIRITEFSEVSITTKNTRTIL